LYHEKFHLIHGNRFNGTCAIAHAILRPGGVGNTKSNKTIGTDRLITISYVMPVLIAICTSDSRIIGTTVRRYRRNIFPANAV
jgi:hypothetical protein